MVSLGGALTISLANTTVTPGSYRTINTVPVFTVDQHGRLSNVTTAPITGIIPGGPAGGLLQELPVPIIANER